MNAHTVGQSDGLRVALVHDWLNQVGGAEDVLADLVALHPGAPIYTSLYQRRGTPDAWKHWPIRPLWTDRLPGIRRHHQPYLPVYPLAFGGLRPRDCDIILSNKSGFCHGVQAAPGTLHICYCLTPTRYLWQFDSYAARESLGGGLKALLRPLLRVMQRWDYHAAQRVGRFIAISSEVQARIKRYYGRDSEIIYPPVDTSRFSIAPPESIGESFLIVSRLIPYKQIDLAVRACTALKLPLIVAGTGRDRERLAALAGPTISFIGRVPEADLPDLMARCKAFLFPGLEDFGIAPVQAQAAGRPVIAFRGGGALDTMIPGETGEFFDVQTVESLTAVLKDFRADRYDPTKIREHAQRFDSATFRAKMADFTARAWTDFRQARGQPIQ